MPPPEEFLARPVAQWHNAGVRQARRVDRSVRVRSALLVATIHAALGWALLTGLGVDPAAMISEPGLQLIDVTEQPEPPPVIAMLPEAAPKPTQKPKDPEGAAAPPNLRNTPTPVVAPLPEVKLPPPPPPLTAAPVAGQGTAAAAGAAPVPGPGTGRGGIGNGLGSGLSGTGPGGGGGGGVAFGPRYLRGSIDWRDVPPAVLAQRPRGTVGFRLLVGRDGRLRDCRVTRSSGYPALDAATCAAALRRLRFAPARDTAGRPVDAWAPGENEWIPRAPPPDRWVDPVLVPDD